MMPQLKAAEYFIVSWVKDWPLRTYWNIINESASTPWDKPNEYFPWLPSDAGIFIANGRTRRYTAENFRQFNDRLFDCDTNAERLALAPLLLHMKPIGGKYALRPGIKDAKVSITEYVASRVATTIELDKNDKLNGHNWNTCK